MNQFKWQISMLTIAVALLRSQIEASMAGLYLLERVIEEIEGTDHDPERMAA